MLAYLSNISWRFFEAPSQDLPSCQSSAMYLKCADRIKAFPNEFSKLEFSGGFGDSSSVSNECNPRFAHSLVSCGKKVKKMKMKGDLG